MSMPEGAVVFEVKAYRTHLQSKALIEIIFKN